MRGECFEFQQSTNNHFTTFKRGVLKVCCCFLEDDDEEASGSNGGDASSLRLPIASRLWFKTFALTLYEKEDRFKIQQRREHFK